MSSQAKMVLGYTIITHVRSVFYIDRDEFFRASFVPCCFRSHSSYVPRSICFSPQRQVHIVHTLLKCILLHVGFVKQCAVKHPRR